MERSTADKKKRSSVRPLCLVQSRQSLTTIRPEVRRICDQLYGGPFIRKSEIGREEMVKDKNGWTLKYDKQSISKCI